MSERAVCFIITSLAYGGAETQLLRVALRLKARGWDVRVVSMTPPRAYVEELESAGIPVASLDMKRKLPDPRPVLRLARLIREWRPDIVHSHMVHANLLARVVRPLAPVPVLVCTAHSIDEGGRMREIMYRLTDPLCDLTTQVSQAGLERYVRVGATPRHRIKFIPNGIDSERFRPDKETRERLRDAMNIKDEFVWLAVGRFYPAKDYPNMIRAFAHVAQERSDARLLIVGDGPLRSEMEELAQGSGLRDQVSFLGIRRDVPELMNAADGYVISSAWEGMANVLLEASASALPIVATDVGGNREVVLDGETGFLVPPKDPQALARAMLRMMSLSEDERRRMGEAGRRYIEERYSLDRVVEMWEELYREFLCRRKVKL